MSIRKKSANSGIDALLGFEFQRNCALYLLLSDYDRFKGREFFLCIEHHDDFLYCYRTNCRNNIEEVHSYQAKKLSGNIWTINKRFSELVAKMLEIGNDLKIDHAPKCHSYTHELTFISNSSIELRFKPKNDEKKAGKIELTHLINEQNCRTHYNSVPDDIKDTIDKTVKSFCNNEGITYFKSELDNLYIQWIDFPRTKQAQIDNLVGLMNRNFPHVSDPAAAVELLLSLFREIEATYNQGKVISLLDNSKRVEGNEIKKAINIIETEQKTFQLWREHSAKLASQFQVPIGIQRNHENKIKNTFELMKDMVNNEHQLIKLFVHNNDYSMIYYSYDTMFENYVIDIKEKYNLNLNSVDIFFTILCAFVEYHGDIS
ncbi:dsDNA nuclease domain-containing protein [Providencia sp. PROV151]|uniref:dsDNA nuclease domain-containing protein n=1 Tax=Providencia sp. PROV151 TaxID=2949861 RepID=UPI00234BFDCF|nr:dsDNA nuclease domain-containing protein [Providencia sp. PROV151]